MSNKRLLSKSMRQSPAQDSFPTTLASFVTRLMLRSNDDENDEIGKLRKENDILQRDNLQLRKELSKYKTDYNKTKSELKSLEKSSEGLCNCDYCDYVTSSYEDIIDKYDKSIQENQLSEKLVKELVKDIIQTNSRLEIFIRRNQILENTCQKLNIHVPTQGMDELNKLLEDLNQSINTSSKQ